MRSLLREVSEVFSVAVAVAAVFLIPYSVVALRIYEDRPDVREARRDPANRLQPALTMAYQLTKVFMLGTAIVVANYVIRTYAFQFERDAAGPAWSYALSMVTSLTVLAMFFAPSVYLLRLKMWAMNRTVARSEKDGRGT